MDRRVFTGSGKTGLKVHGGPLRDPETNEKMEADELCLKKGDYLSGYVVRLLDEERAALRFEDFWVVARFRARMRKGDRVLVKIESLYPGVVFRLVRKLNG